jgi:uncharacterized membrane protein (UPF0127 family)
MYNPFMRALNSNGEVLLDQVKWCDTFGAKLRGLMFRRSIDPREGLVLTDASRRPSIAATSIHMFFVPFDIAAIWLDDQFEIVHMALAKSWHPYYASPTAARYVLEAAPEFLQRVKIGDRLKFEK